MGIAPLCTSQALLQPRESHVKLSCVLRRSLGRLLAQDERDAPAAFLFFVFAVP